MPQSKRCAAAAKVEYSPFRSVLQDANAEGLSGLAVDENGNFIAVSERNRFSGALSRRSSRGLSRRSRSASRSPAYRDGLDTESIAFISPGHYALGTERHEGRQQDAILFLEVNGNEGHVTDEVELDYGAWKQRAGINAGIEAACFADGSLLLGSEVVVTEKGKRYAPIARYTIATKAWSYGRLWLTSDAGKISSLECRNAKDGAIEVIGIERHFGVGRIVRFDVPRQGELKDVQARVALDLIPLIQPLPNYEGITWNAQGDLVLMTDKQLRYRGQAH